LRPGQFRLVPFRAGGRPDRRGHDSSPLPVSRSGRARTPRLSHQWTSASSAPCVTQTSAAPVPAMVSVSPRQSA